MHPRHAHDRPDRHADYPIHLIVRNRPCLVVGAGAVGMHKTRGLLLAGAAVTVVAPRVHPGFDELPVTMERRRYVRGEVVGHRLAIACTDDPAVNRHVFLDGEAAGVWVNSADDPENCSWILPSVARRGDLTVTASTNGRSPAMAAWLRRRFEAELDHRYTQLLDLLADVRAEARAHFGTSEIQGWTEALDGGLFDLVADGDLDAARAALRRALSLPTAPLPAFCESVDRHVPTQGSQNERGASPGGVGVVGT